MSGEMNDLLSVEECIAAHAERNESGGIVFVDASWYFGDRSGRQEYEQGPRIPGAVYVDTRDLVTSKELFPELNPKGLDFLLPTPELFARAMDVMKIKNDDQVIIYGKAGFSFAPRTWLLFKTFGHERVALMQGSLEEWIEQGGPVDTEPISFDVWAKDLVADADATSPPRYEVAPDAKSRIVDMSEMLDIVKNRDEKTVIVDTRGAAFAKGHMPGAVHLPFNCLVDKENPMAMAPCKELQQIIADAGIEQDSEVVLSCGGGVTLCHMALALAVCEFSPPRVYNGSWGEWGKDPDTPKVVSE